MDWTIAIAGGLVMLSGNLRQLRQSPMRPA
jgi:hypothetical protein